MTSHDTDWFKLAKDITDVRLPAERESIDPLKTIFNCLTQDILHSLMRKPSFTIEVTIREITSSYLVLVRQFVDSKKV